ncbi:hypothetical protein PCANC_17987 [Puccinia coronata f. sp. avenae]|uniref:Uncharacterized protein n=1 Tax=Puccinia coronata f. sp. avenae TaxID=200324 RepID=A0A2N5SJE8_9BASI|nr:hypothetical protein PCANC_17987 [Puccinia coronata f. sp. avenae]
MQPLPTPHLEADQFEGSGTKPGPPQPRQIQSILSLNTQTPTQPNIRMTKPISVPQIILTDAEGFQLRIDKESKAEQQSTTLRLRSTPAGPSQFADAPSPEPPAPMNPNKTKEQAENREEIQELNTKYLQVPTLKNISWSSKAANKVDGISWDSEHWKKA